MSDALDAAIRAAMDEQGCEPYKYSEDSLTVCVVHDADDMEAWHVDRYVCGPIARAVTVGFEVGRRDALREVRDVLKQPRSLLAQMLPTIEEE